jgi:hypothetical protein
MRDFVIYMQPIHDWGETKKQVTVEYLRGFPGTGSLYEFDAVKDGKLDFIQEFDGLRVFRFFCKYRSGKSRSAVGEAPIQDLEFELFQKKGGLVAVIQAPKKAARIAVAALSLSVFGDPLKIVPFRLSIPEFRQLLSVVQKYSGKLTRLSLREVEGETGVLRKFEVSGDFEQVLRVNLENILGSARRVSFMGFKIPLFKDSTNFSFRITEWGGGQIYNPADPQLHEISELMELLREAFIG